MNPTLNQLINRNLISNQILHVFEVLSNENSKRLKKNTLKVLPMHFNTIHQLVAGQDFPGQGAAILCDIKVLGII